MATFTPVPTAFTTAPSFQYAPFVSGLNFSVTGNTTFTVSPGSCRALTSGYILQYPSFSPSVPGNTTVDVSTVGLNGCFPLSIASLGLTNNTLFPVYAVFNSSGTLTTPGNVDNGPLGGFVVATGNNFLPTGYNMFTFIGWAPIAEATGYLLPFQQYGNGTERTYLYQDPVTAVASGSATTPTAVDLTNATGVGLVPPKEVTLNLNVNLTGDADGSYVNLEPFGLTAGSAPPTQLVTPTASEPLATNIAMVGGLNASGDASIKYWVDNGSSVAVILVAGFTESLGNTLY